MTQSTETFQSAATKLEELIATYNPNQCADHACALERARHVAEPESEYRPGGLCAFAAKLGFDEGAAYGVMDGWDNYARGYTMCYSAQGKPGYPEGRELGDALAKKYAIAHVRDTTH